VCGLPFFGPFFQPQNKFRLWAGHLSGAMTLKRVLAEFMMSPLFPVPPEVFKSTLETATQGADPLGRRPRNGGAPRRSTTRTARPDIAWSSMAARLLRHRHRARAG